MANICTNLFYMQTENENNFNAIISFLEEYQPYISNESRTKEEDKTCYIEGDFESKWTYPKEDFEKLVKELEDDPTLYIRILSHEFSDEYVHFAVHQNGEWEYKL